MTIIDKELYVRKSQDGQFNYELDYRQTWHHSFNQQGVKPERVYLYNFASPRNQHNVPIALDLLHFILQNTFASEGQIRRYLKMKGHDVNNLLPNILKYYEENRILNVFALSRYPLGEIPNDAMRCYSMDFGGYHILSHYNEGDLLPWTAALAIRGTKFITKYLMTTQFYLALYESIEDKVRYFRTHDSYSLGRREMQVSAVFGIKDGPARRSFILEVLRSSDFPDMFQRKADKFNTLFNKKFISRYFHEPPAVLLLTENIQDALEAGQIFHRNNEYDQFRILTDETIEKGFTETSFMRYDPERDKLVAVKSTLFLPKEQTSATG